MVYTNPAMIKAARMLQEQEEQKKQQDAAKGVKQVQAGTASPDAASAAPRGTDGDSGKPSKAPRSKPKAQPRPKPIQGEKVAAAVPATVARPEQGKKKRGRPAYPQGTPRRDKKITIWVTDAEREIVSLNAKKRGQSVSDYLRGMGLAPTSSVSFGDLRDEILALNARGGR